MFRRLVGLNNLIWRVKRMDSKSFSYLTILIAFLAVFGLSSTAFSQCVVSDGGDDGSANQLRDCIVDELDAVVIGHAHRRKLQIWVGCLQTVPPIRVAHFRKTTE